MYLIITRDNHTTPGKEDKAIARISSAHPATARPSSLTTCAGLCITSRSRVPGMMPAPSMPAGRRCETTT